MRQVYDYANMDLIMFVIVLYEIMYFFLYVVIKGSVQ